MTENIWLSKNSDYPSEGVMYPTEKALPDAIDDIVEYLEDSDSWYSRETYAGYTVVEISVEAFVELDGELANALRQNPNTILTSATIAAEKYFEEDCVVRLTDYPDNFADATVEELSHRDLGQLVVIDGIVDSRTGDQPRTASIQIRCQNGECRNRATLRQHWAIRETETVDECPQCESSMVVNIDDIESADGGEEPLLVDSQRLTLVDVPENRSSDEEQGVMVDLVGDDIINRVDAGERVKIAGIVRIDQSEDMDRNVWIQAVGLQTEKDDFESVEVSEEDIQEIIEYSESADDVVQALSKAIAPSIADREEIKEAVLLSLAGGVHADLPDGSSVRDDIHLMIVGDPSTGKSTMIRSAKHMAPKSRYASGKGMSGVGVTATAEKVEHLDHKEWAVKRGAISSADGGVAVLDELDKMSDTDALNEPMAEQEISVDKASVSSTLPADTTVLSAANPENKRFDPYEPLGEQIPFDEDLVSRFDLVFALRDEPGENDGQIADHVLRAAEGGVATDGGQESEVDQKFVQKYLAFARKEYEPSLSREASETLKDFWIDIRQQGDANVVSIDSRKLEGLQRLAKASAKLRLSDVAELEDAERAIRLMVKSLEQTATDSDGNLDIDIIDTGQSTETRDRRSEVLSAVSKISRETDEDGVSDILVAKEVEYEEETVKKDLEKLVEAGELRRIQDADSKRVIPQ